MHASNNGRRDREVLVLVLTSQQVLGSRQLETHIPCGILSRQAFAPARPCSNENAKLVCVRD